MTSARRKKCAFTEEETSVLLDLWADDRIQAKFNNSFRHNLIWEDIALRMKGMGYNRSWKECYNRVANLKKAFARKKRDFKTGIADAADWTYWSHLESLLKSLPCSTKTVNEDEEEEDSSDQFFRELEPGCDDDDDHDHEEEDDNGEGEEEEEGVNDDTATQLSDSFAVVMEDLDEGEDIVQPAPHTMTATVPVQSSPTARSHTKKKPVMKHQEGMNVQSLGHPTPEDETTALSSSQKNGNFGKISVSNRNQTLIHPIGSSTQWQSDTAHVHRKSKRRAHSDDYYLKQLIENDRQMLRNQQRQLQLDEQVSAAAVQFFSAVTEYLNKMNNAMQPPAEPSVSPPKTVHNPVAASSCSKLSSGTERSSFARTTQEHSSDSSQTTRSVKRLCTADISQTLKCSTVANKVIVVPQEDEIN